MLTRSGFLGLLLGGLTAGTSSARETKYKGVRLGVGTYTFRGLKLDEMIPILSAAKVGGIELESPFVEPAPAAGGRGGPAQREALRQWRLTTPLTELTTVKKRLDRAGITAYAYSVPVNDSFTDEELDRVFLMTKALGAGIFNTSATLPVAKRLAPFAEKHKLTIGLHPGGNANDPDSVGSGASYLKAFEISPRLCANLDLYLFRNWGPDPIAFVKQNHGRISSIHFHDRKIDQTPPAWVPFGEGDLPTRELLLLARNEKYRFPFSIERIYTFQGLDQLTEVRKSLAYCRKVLDE